MSKNKKEETQKSTTSIVLTEAATVAVTSAASVIGMYVGMIAVGYFIQKKNEHQEKKANK